MQLGMIGLGRMGANMVAAPRAGAGTSASGTTSTPRRPSRSSTGDGMTAPTSLEEFVGKLDAPRHVWIMVPAAFVDATIASLVPLLARGDTIIDGGNSWYHDDIKRAAPLAADHGIDYVDVGTSGGVFGLERGYCLMIGGPRRRDRAAGTDLRHPRARRRRGAAHPDPRRARRRAVAPPSGAGCTADRTAPATS